MLAKRTIDHINLADKKTDVNTVWDSCGRYIGEVLEEITHDLTLLKECYCEHRIREFDRKFLPQIFAPHDDVSGLEKIPTKSLEDVVRLIESRVILVLGDVGTGKSTFVHYFFKIEIRNHPRWDIYRPIIVDFKGLSGDVDVVHFASIRIDQDLKQFFIEMFGDKAKSVQMLRDIFEEDLSWNEGLYQHCLDIGRKDLLYEMEIDDIRRYKDDLRHFNKRRMQFCEKKAGKRVVVILDNVDHIEDQDKVKSVFLLGQSLVHEGSCGVIVTMRTYNAYGNVHHYDPYSAFNPRYLHLSLPDVREMIKKRIDFAFRNIDKTVMLDHAGGVRLSVSVSKLREEVHGVLESFATETIIEVLKKLSYYDLRELLRLSHRALASGHLYPAMRREKFSEVQYYDLINALILGNWRYYNPEDEHLAVINLFDDECAYGRGKVLIRIRLLETIGVLGTRMVSVRDVLEYMGLLGFDRDDVINSLQKMIHHSLVSPVYPTGMDLVKNKIRAVNLNEKGIYYLDDLMLEPRYYENMRFATYMEKDFWDVMNSYAERSDAERYEGTKVFVEFIGHVEEEWRVRVKDRDLYSRYPSIFERVRSSFNKHCCKVGKPHLAL